MCMDCLTLSFFHIIPFSELLGSTKATRSKPAGPPSTFPHPPSHTRSDTAAKSMRKLQGPPLRQTTGPTVTKKKAAAKCEPSLFIFSPWFLGNTVWCSTWSGVC